MQRGDQQVAAACIQQADHAVLQITHVAQDFEYFGQGFPEVERAAQNLAYLIQGLEFDLHDRTVRIVQKVGSSAHNYRSPLMPFNGRCTNTRQPP